jgi:transcriptional regulator with XRE-family HTH domain
MPDALQTLSFGARLRALRKERRIKQVNLATRAGISAPHLSRIEADKAAPSATTVLKLARELEADPTELLSLSPAVSSDERLLAPALAAARARPACRPGNSHTWISFRRVESDEEQENLQVRSSEQESLDEAASSWDSWVASFASVVSKAMNHMPPSHDGRCGQVVVLVARHCLHPDLQTCEGKSD